MAKHECQHLFAALSAYLDRELPQRSCRQLEKHLKDCPPCIAYLESLKRTIFAMQEYRVPDIPPPSPRARKALLAALEKRRRP